MKQKLVVTTFALFALTACKQEAPPSQQPPVVPNSNEICISSFMNSNQINELAQKMETTSKDPTELQASILTQILVSKIGAEKTVQLLQSGLLIDLLAQMKHNQFAQVPEQYKSCKTKNGDAL